MTRQEAIQFFEMYKTWALAFDMKTAIDVAIDAMRELEAESACDGDSCSIYQYGKHDAHLWTPISFSTPPVGVPVLVTLTTGTIEIATLEPGRTLWQGSARCITFDSVVAWQALPAAYDPEEDE